MLFRNPVEIVFVGEPRYPDPLAGAPLSFQQRLADLSSLENETIRWERTRRFRKKGKAESKETWCGMALFRVEDANSSLFHIRIVGGGSHQALSSLQVKSHRGIFTAAASNLNSAPEFVQ